MTFLTRFRYWLAGLAILNLALLVPGLAGLRLDNSFEIWFPQDDPALVTYQAHLEEFGGDEVVVLAIAVSEGEALGDDTRYALEQLHRALVGLDGVASVQSYASIPAFDAEDDFLAAETDRLSAYFVDGSDSTFKLIVTMSARADIESLRHSVLLAIDAEARAAFPNAIGVWLAGTGVILDALNTETIAESALFLPLSYGAIIMLLAWLTRSWRWTGLAVLVVSGANFAMFGLMGWMDRPITMITMALPPIALVVTVCSVLHLQRSPDGPGHALKPVIYSCLTTAGGFLSLAFADMAITRDYGFFAAVVILVSLFLTLSGLPFVRDLAPGGREAAPAAGLAKRFSRYPRWVAQHRIWIVVAVLAFTAIAVPQLSHLRVDTYSLGFLPDDHRAPVANREIEARFGAYMPLEFAIAFEQPQDLDSQALLEHIHELQSRVQRQLESVGDSFSYVEALSVNALIGRYAPDADAAGIEPSRWVDDSGRRFRVTWAVPMSSARELELFANDVVEIGRAVLGEDATLVATGYLPLYSRLIEQVVADQVKGLSLALIVVFALIACWFRDARMVIMALAVNLPPIVFLLVSMALLGVPLDIATITVAPAMLGLIVDDSMHLLYRYRQQRERGLSTEDALAVNMETVGRTLIATSTVLVIGFGVLGFSSVSSIAVNGLLMAWTVVLALAADLWLLPAVAAFLGGVDSPVVDPKSARKALSGRG
jgi:predicted RND superfamily exporter protein